MSKLYSLHYKQTIPASLDTVWNFMSSPKNLKEITPTTMGFDITTQNLADKVHAGMIISYKVKPILGIKLNWVTEITHLEENKFFVDEHRFGPYKFWHHQHHLNVVPGGVEMIDLIHYKLPMGIFGRMGNSLFVKKQLKQIFEFRFKALESKFGKMPV